MSAPIQRIKAATGKLAGSIKNAVTQMGSGPNTPQAIKGAVGMCGVGGGSYKKIKGAVSG